MAKGEFRIYVACLASYNNGKLYGQWVDVEGLDGDDINQQIDAVIKSSPEPGAEEFAIHDYDGIPSTFGEWPDFDAIAEWVAAAVEYGAEVLRAASDCFGADYAISQLEDGAYQGEYSTEREFAHSFIGDTDYMHGWPDEAVMYFDYDSFARDLFITDYVMVNGHVFRNT